jgi:adenylylsulfate kinase-like enzyme
MTVNPAKTVVVQLTGLPCSGKTTVAPVGKSIELIFRYIIFHD